MHVRTPHAHPTDKLLANVCAVRTDYTQGPKQCYHNSSENSSQGVEKRETFFLSTSNVKSDEEISPEWHRGHHRGHCFSMDADAIAWMERRRRRIQGQLSLSDFLSRDTPGTPPPPPLPAPAQALYEVQHQVRREANSGISARLLWRKRSDCLPRWLTRRELEPSSSWQ
jgi:hypothetical protein